MCATRGSGLRALVLLCALGMLFCPGAQARSIYAHAENPLEIASVYPVAGDEQQYYPAVSGLLDSEVERSVNERIEAFYGELSAGELPGYRGVGVLLRKCGGRADVRVRIEVAGCVDNLLSLTGEREITLVEQATGAQHDIDDIAALTLDLRTGREVAFADLFRAGSPWRERVNAQFNAYLLSRGAADEDGADSRGTWSASRVSAPDFAQIAPFAGVRDDQPFFIRSYWGFVTVHLVIGDETPEFETFYRATTWEVPLCAEMNFNESFAADAPLYRRGDGGWFLTGFWGECEPVTEYARTANLSGEDGGLTREDRVIVQDGWPEAIRADVLGLPGRTGLESAAAALYEEDRAQGGASDFAVTFENYNSRVGPYLNALYSARICERPSSGGEITRAETDGCALYRLDTGAPVGIDALFCVPDGRKRLADALRAVMLSWPASDRQAVAPGVDADDPRWETCAQALIDGLRHVRVGETELEIWLSDGAYGRLPEGFDARALATEYGRQLIEYAQIGYENLAIFD